MNLIIHGRAEGPCLSPNIKVWGKAAEVEACQQRIRDAVGRRTLKPDRHYRVRADFHLSGARLKLSDLDNLAKTVLDGIFPKRQGSSPNVLDRFIWQLELNKIEDENEFTEFWVFDAGQA